MKRIHLFEFEDLSWFPSWLRDPMTNLILVMHRLLKTDTDLKEIVGDTLRKTGRTTIFDFCSGGGGLMPEVVRALNENEPHAITLQLSDLYPNKKVVESINRSSTEITYVTEPVDVTSQSLRTGGLRTMVCSFHHMKPETARSILKSASDAGEPMVVYEMSDNSIPKPVAFFGLITTFLTCLFITPFAKRLTLSQLVLTYIVPVIPICFAWDGTVSNLRTYTESDLNALLEPIRRDGYYWEIITIKKNTKRLALIGIPTS